MPPAPPMLVSERSMALLVIIVDDEMALRVLAAWASLKPQMSQLHDDATRAELARIAAASLDVVDESLRRLQAAEVLVDGGITEVATKMLQAQVQQRFGVKRR